MRSSVARRVASVRGFPDAVFCMDIEFKNSGFVFRFERYGSAIFHNQNPNPFGRLAFFLRAMVNHALSSRRRASPKSAQVMASNSEDLPAPFEPEMQAMSKPSKSRSTGSWYEKAFDLQSDRDPSLIPFVRPWSIVFT